MLPQCIHTIPAENTMYWIRKCCPIQFVYSEVIRDCVPQNNDALQSVQPHPLMSLISSIYNSNETIDEDTVDILTGRPKCQTGSREEVLESHSLTTSELLDILPKDPFNRSNFEKKYCIDLTTDAQFFELDNLTWTVQHCSPTSVCSNITCTRKCCKYHHILFDKSSTTFCGDKESNMTLFNAKNVSSYGVIVSPTCSSKYFVKREIFQLEKLFKSTFRGSLQVVSHQLTNKDSCEDHYSNGIDPVVLKTFVCYHTELEGNKTSFIYSCGLCVSSVFLVLTIIIYSCSPKVVLQKILNSASPVNRKLISADEHLWESTD